MHPDLEKLIVLQKHDVEAPDEGALGGYERRGAREVSCGNAGPAGMVLSASGWSGWLMKVCAVG